ncbi:MAG: hypothetical protein AAB074_15650 [Planctomycetota bacterium]
MRPIAVLFLAAGLAWAEDSGFVTRTHDVRALRATGSSKPGPRLSLKTIPDTSAVENGEEYEEVAAFDAETLTWAIQRMVEPESWEAGDASLDIAGDGWMTVKQTKQAQEKIVAALNVLARIGARRVVVDAEVMLLAPGVLETAGLEAGVVTDAQEQSLREAAAGGTRGRTVAVLRSGGAPGLRFHAADVRERQLVVDYDIEIAQAATVADPFVQKVLDGTVLDVRPVLAPDGATVLLEYRFQCARPGTVLEFDAKAKPEGKIQLPSRAAWFAAGTWPCPSGRTVLLVPGGVEGIENGWTLVALVRAKRVEEPLGDLAAGLDDLKMRFLEAGTLQWNVTDFPGQRLDLSDWDEQQGGVIFIEDPRNPGLDDDTLGALLRQSAGGEDAWSVEGRELRFRHDRIMAVAPQGILEATEAALKGMAELRLKRVAVDAVVVALEGRERGDLPAADVLAAARKGDRARVVAGATALGLTGQRVHAFAGAESLFVRDRDVEIAQEAAATDPVNDVLREGLLLDVRPFAADAGGRARVELQGQFGWRSEIAAFGTGAEHGGDIHRTTIDLLEIRTDSTVKAGEWTAVTEARREGPAETLLLLIRVRFPEVR